jgi:predicted nucleic acid-binding protein
MPERWVVNASPLILLAKIDHQHLLSQLADELIVPQAVVDEINAGPHDDPARQFLADSPLPIASVVADPIVLTWDLGAGETAVLSYAYNHAGWRVVIDDGAARRCARALDVSLIGTLGVILSARKADLIPDASSSLKLLLAHGYRLDEAVIRKVLLQAVGEEWE